MIVVRNGARLAPEEEAPFWNAAYEHLLAPVVDAVCH